MSEPARCPYCSQPLVSGEAIKHLHATQERLRRELADEANAAAAQKIREANAAAMTKVQEAKAAAEKRIQQACAAAERKVRDTAERERSKHERGLQHTIEILQRHNKDLERRLDGLNAPDRGEFNEADIAKALADAFPDDEITREGKGGDIVQVVQYHTDNRLERAGVILYECKDTKTWSSSFVSQVKADGRTRRTPYLLLVSRALPGKEKGTCVAEDVIIADPVHAPHMARILRRMVIETHRAELTGQDRAGKTARLYEYLRGDDFREELSAVVEAGNKLTNMLQAERKDHEKTWIKRQHTYDELLHNSVAIDEEIHAIIESTMPRKASQASRAKRKTLRANGSVRAGSD